MIEHARIRIPESASSSLNIIKEVRFACRIEDLEKCIKQSAPTVERNAKFRLNPTEADPYTAKNVIPNEDPYEDIKLIR